MTRVALHRGSAGSGGEMAETRFHSGISARRMQVLHVGDGIATGAIDNVFVVVWRAPQTLERMRMEREGLRSTIRKHRGKVAMVCVVEASSAPPSDELKREAKALLAEHERDLVSAACVIEGDGFRAATMRAALSTIQLMLGRRRFVSRFFATVAEACAFTEPNTTTPFDSLAEAIEELRAMLDAEESVTLIRARTDLLR
jgi:FAD/FMN-containing dehydrogenase